MKYLHAFFLAAGRPAVAILIFLTLVVTWALITTLTRGVLGVHTGPGFLSVLLLPAFAGLVAAQVVGELQHCSFAWPLPGVRSKTAFGFLAAGAMVVLIVVGLNAQRAEASPPVLMAVGLIAYFLGSLMVDPLSPAVSTASLAAGLAILASSAAAAELATAHPAATIAVALATAGLCVSRFFGRRTFRRKPFRPTRALAASPDQAQRYERERRLASKPADRPWRQAYLGTDVRAWTRASFYERWGDFGWAEVFRSQRFWLAILLAFGLDAVIDRGDGRYLDSLANIVYHAFFRPPDQPSFGDKPDPHLLVAWLIAFLGASLAFSKPAAVEEGRPYPLARVDRFRIAFQTNLATAGLFFLTVALGFFLVGQGAGWAVGLPLRLDFAPHFLRALLATLTLMPAVFWIRLRTRSFQDRPPGERGLVTILWSFAICGVVTAWCYIFPLLLPSPAVELAVTAVLIGLSQAIYRRRLERHFATADLA